MFRFINLIEKSRPIFSMLLSNLKKLYFRIDLNDFNNMFEIFSCEKALFSGNTTSHIIVKAPLNISGREIFFFLFVIILFTWANCAQSSDFNIFQLLILGRFLLFFFFFLLLFQAFVFGVNRSSVFKVCVFFIFLITFRTFFRMCFRENILDILLQPCSRFALFFFLWTANAYLDMKISPVYSFVIIDSNIIKLTGLVDSIS